jgi:DNA invertase Pin-like site-specific DNA recombinase
MPGPGTIRCAIYTRRSIRREDRFSSCSAQWIACWDHVWARRPLGWFPITSEWYEDDGESGGELARPGLDRLLTAIRERRVERVVVYRLDRLTRSVHHWAQIAALLVEHRVGSPWSSTVSSSRTTRSRASSSTSRRSPRSWSAS